ncbi:MAG: twin-arginine translocase TatA/TatE family subunit [Solirubrobacteraceae bacterium]
MVWCRRPVLLLLFGAERLPAMGRSLGTGLRGFSVMREQGARTAATDAAD